MKTTINILFALTTLILITNLVNAMQPPLPNTVTMNAEGITLTLPEIHSVKDGLKVITNGYEDCFVDAGDMIYSVKSYEKYTFTAYRPGFWGKIFGKTSKWVARKQS